MRLEAKEAPAPSTELATISAVASIVPAEFFRPNGSAEILAALKDEVRKQALALDISTETGRAAIASLAYKVARSKTALDEQGKKLVEGEKSRLKAIDIERGHVWDEMEALQKEVRKPLTDWENAEKSRVACHEFALAAIAESPEFGLTESSAELAMRLEFLSNFPARDWQEFAARAAKALSDEVLRTEALLARAEKREAAAAEAERQRAEAVERAIKEREEAAARAATEAAQCRAEEQARLAAVAAERERQRIENEKAEAEARAKQAEAQRVADAEFAEQKRLAAEKETARQLELAEQRRIAEAAQAQRDQDAAIEAERARVAAEKKREAEEAEKRAKNRAHQASVNREILAAMAKLGIPEDIGKDIVAAMAKGEVPHVSIAY